MTAPLTNLLRKSVQYQWTLERQNAFDELKRLLCEAPTLLLPDLSKSFEVVCDASGFGLGAVLVQHGRPVAYEGRTMTDAERKYSVTEQECLPVVHALQCGGATLKVVTLR